MTDSKAEIKAAKAAAKATAKAEKQAEKQRRKETKRLEKAARKSSKSGGGSKKGTSTSSKRTTTTTATTASNTTSLGKVGVTVRDGTAFGAESDAAATAASGSMTLVPMPQMGRAPHQYHELGPGTDGTITGASLPALAERQSMGANPWRTLRAKTVRPRRSHLEGRLQALLDSRAVAASWYGLHLPRDAAMAVVDNNLDVLPDGAFVVAPAGLDLGVLCMVNKGLLVNLPIRET